MKEPDFEFRYNLISFYDVSYKEMINSTVAEQVILAILCNYERVDAKQIFRKILLRLQQICEGLKLQKYLQQLRTLAQLRNKQNIVKEEEHKMISKIFDITKDPYYIEGVEKGTKKGIKKGIEKDRYLVALNMIKKDYTNEQIVDILNLELEQIEVIRKKYNELDEKTFNWIDNQFISTNI